MIPFEELSMALDRYKRRQAGEQVPVPATKGPAPAGRPQPDHTSEFSIDEVEEA